MNQRMQDIYNNQKPETIWMLEHEAVITKGVSAKSEDIINNPPMPIIQSARGGQITYHGPGQIIVYIMLDLQKHQTTPDLKKYVYNLQLWIINILSRIGIKSFCRDSGRIGVWTNHNNKEKKIAAIGVKVSRWITYHGIAININPNLEHYKYIIPCGITQYGITSAAEINPDLSITHAELHKIIREEFDCVF